MKWSLRTQILLSVGVLIFLVLGTSTGVHIQFLKREYYQAVEWRAEALAQQIVTEVQDIFAYIAADTPGVLDGIGLRCQQLYETNKAKGITHVTVIKPDGTYAAHHDRQFKNTTVQSQRLRDAVQRPEQITVLDGALYHTLMPIVATEAQVFLGMVDIGFPKQSVDAKVRQILWQSLKLFGLFAAVSVLVLSVLLRVMLTQPVQRLIRESHELAQGRVIQTITARDGRNEIVLLETAFAQIADYFQAMAAVASHIATGVLDGRVAIRSEDDVLGQAVQKMLQYLQNMAAIARKVAEGDLTATVPIRSEADHFGKSMQLMTDGLHALILQIHSSAERMATTQATISTLATTDIGIVQEVHAAAERTLSTTQQMGGSLEDVAHNMTTLSSSVEETSASVTQMTASIAYIAQNATHLTQQVQETVAYLETVIHDLTRVVTDIDVSNTLSHETMNDALAGQHAVEQMMHSMQTIHETITVAVENMTQFAQRSQDIGTILEVIREITEQTSLLALNASIIAAQAGVHGRGFAVVADEIRNLANGVGNSTKDIAAIVQTLQHDTDRVVRIVHQGAANVQQGMERTAQAQQTLAKIIASAQRSSAVVTTIAGTVHDLMATGRQVREAMQRVHRKTDEIMSATVQQEASTKQIQQAIAQMTDMAFQIQHATEEQSTGVRDVVEAMAQVNRLIDHNLASSQRITNAADELAVQVDLLIHSVDRFKLKTIHL